MASLPPDPLEPEGLPDEVPELPGEPDPPPSPDPVSGAQPTSG